MKISSKIKQRVLLALVASLLIHLTFMCSFDGGDPPGGQNQAHPPIKIIVKGSDKPKESEKQKTKPVVDNKSKVTMKKKKKKPKPPKKEEKKGRECEKDGWYGGIGITMNGSRVGEIYPGYPAMQAGLLPDDLIIEPGDGEIRGEPGTVVKMKIMRGSKVHNFSITRDKICYVISEQAPKP